MSKLIHTKESLILSTIEVISEKGLHGLTTREVAKRQGISESTIFKHYKSKNQLILAVLDYYSQYDQAIMDSLCLKDYTPIEAITFFVESYVTYYENYPEITAITQSYEGLMCEPELRAVVYNIFSERVSSIRFLIEEAISKNALPKEINPESMADLIIGIERGVMLRWRMSNFGFSLKDHTLKALNILLNAFEIK